MNYKQLMEKANAATPGKEARKANKELKKRGDGFPVWFRYPCLAITLALVALVVSVVAATISVRLLTQ